MLMSKNLIPKINIIYIDRTNTELSIILSTKP